MTERRLIDVPEVKEAGSKPNYKPDDYWIDELVGALFDPIIVWPSPWNADMPKRVMDLIPIQRLAMNMMALRGEKMTATDAEAIAYMYARTMEGPLNESWTEIYLYLGTQCFRDSFPGDIKKEELTKYQMGLLNHLKDWIYAKRLQARKEKRRQQKKAEKEGQPEKEEDSFVQCSFDF